MKRLVFIILGLVLLGSVALVSFKLAESTAGMTTFTVVRGTLAEEVAVTGKTRFQQSYKLTADRAGRVSDMVVSVSEAVKKNEILLRLDNGRRSITSPVDGVVVKIDVRVGDVLAPNAPLVQIVESGKKEIETFISETDISRIRMDNSVDIVYDAFPDEAFKGKIAQIDWVETPLDGVVHYKVIVRPLEDDERILSGFSANLSIVTSEKKNILLLPEHVILERDGESLVNRYKDGKTEERIVKTGKRDQYGNIEILEGLQEGDQVVQKNVKK